MIASVNYGECRIYPGQTFHPSTGDCSCGGNHRGPWVVIRAALRNEFGGVTRTVELDQAGEGTAWQYAYDESHRAAYPATAHSVQVQMRDGSWTNATIIEGTLS